MLQEHLRAKATDSPAVPTFIVDGMLGSIARKLRILGFDTFYDPSVNDVGLLKIASSTERVLVTNDQDLFLMAKRRKLKSIRSGGKTERDRLYEVLAGAGQ